MRFADDQTDSINPDFVPRTHGRPLYQLLFVYGLAIGAIFFISQYRETFGGDFLSSVLVSCVVVGIATYTLMFRQQNIDLMMATEFENLLFSAAASLGSNFCLFLRADGTIVYSNDGTRELFPRIIYDESRALDDLLDDGNVSKTDRNRIYSALSSGEKETLIFPITDADNNRIDFILMIEPLKRPRGYFVMRGRRYYPDRKDTVKLPERLRATSLDKITSIMDNVAEGVYTADKHGTIEFMNGPLIKHLGFKDATIEERKTTVSGIIYEADGFKPGEFDVVDYRGDVLLQYRSGKLGKATLQQWVHKDPDGSIVGCSGIVTTNE
ncbi:MAG: hypothetical protein MRY32_01930 [Rickettsiales bacterium]|nr:hypothetical protein [Rickettsiales bacterium]